MVTLCSVGHFVYSLVTLHTLSTVIAHSFCIVDLFIKCINNLHMYRTLYQAGMYQAGMYDFIYLLVGP